VWIRNKHKCGTQGSQSSNNESYSILERDKDGKYLEAAETLVTVDHPTCQKAVIFIETWIQDTSNMYFLVHDTKSTYCPALLLLKRAESNCKTADMASSKPKSHLSKLKLNSMVWVRERTIPTERPPLVGEVIANFLWIEGATWSWRIPTAVFSVF
jgi:hypothetical protein